MSLIPIRGNGLGIAMFVLAGLLIIPASMLLRVRNLPTMIAVGCVLILMDMLFRLCQRTQAGWLTKRELGGYFFFLPVWVLGLVVIGANVINAILTRSP